MSSTSRAWLVAASIGAVEALKDQGFCRWNYAFRLLQQRAKANLHRSYTTTTTTTTQANKKICSASMLSNSKMMMMTMREEKLKRSEESLRTVMYLSCWGPNS